MYHEGAAVSLLELLVYHCAACEAIGDSTVDLIDYCHRTLVNASSGRSSIARHELLKHLDIAHLEASIAIRCISILRYLACHADKYNFIFIFKGTVFQRNRKDALRNAFVDSTRLYPSLPV